MAVDTAGNIYIADHSNIASVLSAHKVHAEPYQIALRTSGALRGASLVFQCPHPILGFPNSFPQPSTERFPNLVTNNLYSENRKAHARLMREGSSKNFSIADSSNGSKSQAKSLLQNSLAATPCGSRFYLDSPYTAPASPKE